MPWSSRRWRARRRINTEHSGHLHGRVHAQGHVKPRCRSGGNVGRGKGFRRRHRSGGGPPAWRNARGAITPPRCAPAHGGRGGRHHARAGGSDRTPRDVAPLTARLEGVRNRRRAAATEASAQERSPAGHCVRVEPRKSLRAVAARNSGWWGSAGGQTTSGPCDTCGRTDLLSDATLFAFSIMTTLPRQAGVLR